MKDELYARWLIKPEKQLLVAPSAPGCAKDYEYLLDFVPWLAVGDWLEHGDEKCCWDLGIDLDLRLVLTEAPAAKGRCRACGAASEKKCAGCLVARYCSAACQLADWRAHRDSCRRWA